MTSESSPRNDSDSGGKTRRKKIKKLEVMVAEVVPETHDTVTLKFFTGNDKLDYKPGHFLTIDPHQFLALERFTAYLEDVKGRKEPPRAYSISSAPHERDLAITIKEERYVSGQTEFPPLLSPLVVRRTPVGTRMEITGFTGPYVLSDDIENQTDHLVHICAGSGSVPNFSIIKHALHHDMKLRHTLIYSNKTVDDTIFLQQLLALEKAHRDRLRVIYAMTREKSLPEGLPLVELGRVNTDMISRYVEDVASAHFFVCGPGVTKWDKKAAKAAGTEPAPRFLESALAALRELGVQKHQLHEESYG